MTHLAARGAAVALPCRSLAGRLVEVVDDCLAALFRRAPGLHMTQGSTDWGEPMFRAWGRALALQHRAARDFGGSPLVWRQDWRREPVFVRGLARLRGTDSELTRIVDALLGVVERRGGCLGEVGMIHADFAPQNFRYDPARGVTAFDFDNCCRHWFLYDLAVSKSVLRREADRDRLFGWITAGYAAVAPLPGNLADLPMLLRLRLLYVYCDRLHLFGVAPD